MFKRDIMVNYGSLEALIKELNTYIDALDDIRSAVKSILVIIEKGCGLTTNNLKEKDDALVYEIDQVQTEIRSLATILQNYVTDMTAIISPVVRSSMMQVDRNDIFLNKESIKAACQSVSAIPINVHVPAYSGGITIWDDEEEVERKRRNGDKLDAIRSTLSSSSSKFNELISRLDKLYGTVKRYENMDDTYADKAKKLKSDNTTFWEGAVDILQGRKESVENYYKGLFTALEDCITGLADACKGTGKYVGAAAMYAACGEADVPDWAKKCYNETNEKVLAVLKDPMIIGEAIAQGASDGLDQKGTAYCAGYVGGVVATSVAADKGLNKLGEMAKGTKFLGKTDDVANAAAKVDDVVTDSLDDVANASRKSPDVIMKVSESSSTTGFKYKHNPSDNPKVLQDAIENKNAIYGYSPNPNSESIGGYADAIDWSNPTEVAKATARREAYHIKNDNISELAIKMKNDGYSAEEIARAANQQRNLNRLNDYNGDIEGLGRVKSRNRLKYGNENGPTTEYLFEKYGSWDKVIEKSMSANPGMDACCGLYDKYFHLYSFK